MRRTFAVPAIATLVSDSDEWRTHVENLLSLDSPQALAGAAYLARRSVPLEIAMLSGAMFARDWYGHPAVVFPLHDEAGNPCAAQGREIFGCKKLIAGSKKNGIFTAHAIGPDGTV